MLDVIIDWVLKLVSQNRFKRCCPVQFSVVLLIFSCTAQGQIGKAVRQLPYDFHPGDLVKVSIQIAPPAGTTNWSVREVYPVGWNFVSSTNLSATNYFIGELDFGPFYDETPRILDYQVASIMDLTNSVDFRGNAVFNGNTNLIVGTTRLPARNEWLFVGPQTLAGGTVSGTAYGRGRWVASQRGWITTLEAGGRATYPRAPRYFGEGYSRLAYVGDLFLLFGGSEDGAQVMVSDDGLKWKRAEDETGDANNININGSFDPFFDPFEQLGGKIHSVAFGNGVYVAAGYHYYQALETSWAGAIWRSTNGTNWRRVFRLLSPERDINAVTFTNGLFMAVADKGTLLKSANGQDWTEFQPATDADSTNRDLHGICYGPAGWIVPTSVAGIVLQSPDGESWTKRTAIGSGNELYWQSFYADGRYWFSTFTDVYTTTDGTAWTRLPSLPHVQPLGPVSRAPDGVNPQYLSAGAPFASVVSSLDGDNWILALPAVNAVWPRYLSVAIYGNEWVVSSQGEHPSGRGSTPSDRPGDLWVPDISGALNVRSEGGEWRQGDTDKVYADLLTTTNGLLAVGADRNGRLFANFLVGNDFALASSSKVLPYLHRLVPGVSYFYKGLNRSGYQFVNAALAKTPNGFDLYAETYSEGNFDPSPMTWGHFTSVNGSDWELRTDGLNNVTNYPGIRGLVWGAGRFVAVSEGLSPEDFGSIKGPLISDNRIYTSIDGEDYMPVDLSNLTPGLSGEGLTSVAYAEGKFVAVGSYGSILASTNGVTWVTVRVADGHGWNRVRYLGGTWAAVGNAGWVAFSMGGENWTSKSSGTESDLTDIGYQNGRYMMVGKNAMVLLSLPVEPPRILVDSLLNVPGSGWQFKVTGQGGKILDVQTSTSLVNWTSLVITTNTTGTVTIVGRQPNQEQRFYRVVQQP